MSSDTNDRKSFLFTRLILTFHSAAMQQMGKLADPFSGKIVRDLEQASLSIDTLDMLLVKCKGNLTQDEANLLEHSISELKLNYIDEIDRPEQKPEEPEPDSPEPDSPEPENQKADEN